LDDNEVRNLVILWYELILCRMKYQNQGGNDRISVDKFANKTFLNYKFDKLLFMLKCLTSYLH